MKFAIVVLAVLAVANAAPWHHHEHDDGQWHGEGLAESQDWANHHDGFHAAAIVAPHAAVVTHHGVVHAGVVAHGHHGGWTSHHHW